MEVMKKHGNLSNRLGRSGLLYLANHEGGTPDPTLPHPIRGTWNFVFHLL